MYKLVIQDDEGKTTVVPLIRDELTIGRKEGNTIRLTERNVSRSHARLTRSNGTVVIEDLGSYNGIRVNGSRIQGRATIAETDRVQIGDYLIEIRSAAAAEASAPVSDETQPVERLAANGAAIAEASPVPTIAPIAADSGPAAAAAAAVIPTFPAKAANQKAVALADTDPGRGAAASVSNHGRLVVLSTNFPGQEFVLEKPSMVVGRTDENDIWLNHRSISRHHAKVVLENGRYSIEDLQSSNGVRVNGEEYGKVELRRADVIDLGHVRLRFVEPGEDFVFGRDAQPVEVFPEGGNKLWLYLGLGAVAIGGLVAAIVVMNNNSDTTAGATGGSGTGTAQVIASLDASVAVGDGPGTAVVDVQIDAGQVIAVVVDAGLAVEPDDEANDKKVQQLVVLANKQFKSENWAKVVETSNEILALEEANEAGKILARKAGTELEAQERLKQLQKIRNGKQYREIKRLSDSLRNTASQNAGQSIANRAQNREYRALRASAARAVGAKDCALFERTAKSAVFSSNRNRILGDLKCEVAVVANGDGDGDTDPPDTGPTADEIRNKLRQASISAAWGSALKQCQALTAKGAMTGADRMKCAVAACKTSSRSKAIGYRNSTPTQANKNRITQSCLTAGVKLD